MAGTLLRERLHERRQARRTDEPKGGSPPGPPTGLGFSALDFKLGLRMLVRYPGLTVLGGTAMAFAIFTGAATFELLNQGRTSNSSRPRRGRGLGGGRGRDQYLGISGGGGTAASRPHPA